MVHLRSLFFFMTLLMTIPVKAQKPTGVFYEIFVRSFYDSNGDGIGDIKGITTQLPYLKSLGIDGIWLTPFHKSPTYHKYDVVDYKSVDPEYGTLSDIDSLLAEAHNLKIKVIMDFVVNHTALDHPWFQASARNEKPYSDYYVWADSRPVVDSVHWYPNPTGGKGWYYGFFWKGMPDLNFDNPKVRDEIVDVGKFWMARGFDGFRLDAAQHIYDADVPGPNVDWWKEFRHRIEPEYPNIFLLGEVWNKTEKVKEYLDGALDACFNFDLSWGIQNAFTKDSASGFIAKFIETRNEYLKKNKGFVDAIFLTNHDQDRIGSVLNNSQKDMESAIGILMTLPGLPFLYYGEEIGMLGKFPDELRREPFSWGNPNNIGDTRWEKLKYSNTVRPFQIQVKDSSSMWRVYFRWLLIRHTYKWIETGFVKDFYNPQYPQVVQYQVSEKENGKGEKLTVFVNLSDSPIEIKTNAIRELKITLGGNIITVIPQ